ncbi:MAG: PCRF domain-containing protein, partial [Candidatus Moranbacteria bacterium]|nr:PCRF domain-containing protein [Candidatus Moranbacteria bacterium]
MNSQIKEIKKEYEEVSLELNSPEIATNSEKMTKLSKRRAELTEVVEVISKLEKVEHEMKGNAEIINSEEDAEMKEMAMEENTELSHKKATLEKELEFLLVPKDPNDKKNVIIEIRAGAGGDESALFAGDLFRMYSRFAEKNGWKIDLLNSSPTGIGGYKEVIFEITSISGDGVFGKMKYESGVHRVQRIPETEKSGRIHTSTATVAVLPEVEEV